MKLRLFCVMWRHKLSCWSSETRTTVRIITPTFESLDLDNFLCQHNEASVFYEVWVIGIGGDLDSDYGSASVFVGGNNTKSTYFDKIWHTDLLSSKFKLF